MKKCIYLTRNALKRHNLNLEKLWNQNPPKAFRFISQDSSRVKTSL